MRECDGDRRTYLGQAGGAEGTGSVVYVMIATRAGYFPLRRRSVDVRSGSKSVATARQRAVRRGWL